MTSVLVVEDDALLAYALAGNLRDGGFRVIGPAASLAVAHRLLADNKIDVACLDVRLGEMETSVPLAHSLAALGIPFVFLTAYPVAYLPIDMRDRPKLEKPFEPNALVDRLADLVEQAAAARRPRR
jgi:DNA-binding response OmpR family regulator